MMPPKPTAQQIEKWIWSGAKDSLRGHPPSADEAVAPSLRFFGWGSENARRFNGARQALERASTKNNVDAVPPFRRLRRNQSAVNESLVDAVRGLLAVVRQLGNELDVVNAKLKDLQMQIAEQRVPLPAASQPSDATPECE